MRIRVAGSRRWFAGVCLLGTVACLLALVSVLGAGAAVSTKGVIGYFGGTGTSAGKLTTPRGVAVNQSSGNVYTVDGANNRVVEFNSNGEFLRAFGAEVVVAGPDLANEEQALTVNAASGGYTLTFNGQTTGSILATATASQVQSELNTLSTVSAEGGSVTVTGGPGNAGGTVPYVIVFNGGPLAHTNVAQITATNVSLTGGNPSSSIATATAREGAAGFDVCVPASGDTCKAGITGATAGAMNAPQGIAVNQETGNVYVTDQTNLRVDEFGSNGNFIAAFGQAVVSSGPDLVAAASAAQTLTVTATGGKYTLSFGTQSTGELAYNASASAIQTALTGLTSIGSGNATISETSSGVYKVTFAGALANNPEPLIVAASGSGEPLTGGSVGVASATAGATGFDVCKSGNGDVCKAGTSASTGGALKSTFNGYPAVAPVGAPNAGNVLVADPGNSRIQEFSSAGVFVRAVGLNVVSAGPDNNGTTNFEVCSAVAGDACQGGTAGAANGQFAASTPTRVAEDASGNLYTVEPTTNLRVQKFTLPSNVPTPQGTFDASDLTGTSSSGATQNNPTDVAIDPATGDLLVTKVFPAGSTASCPVSGAASVQERRVLEVSSAGVLQATHMACAGIDGEVNGLAMQTSASSGNVYVSSNTTASRLYVLNTGQPIAPTASITGVTGVGAHGATIAGLVNPNGPELPYGNETTYRFEYKRSTESTYSQLSASEASAGNRTTNKLVSQQLEGLRAETSYDVRLAATKPFGAGTTTTTPVTFTTLLATPEVTVPQFVSLTGTTAQLQGTVNPNNSTTGYHFEYTTDAAYQASGFAGATRTPSSDATIGSGASPVLVDREVTGLTPGLTYQVRLVASNTSGTTVGAPVVFTVQASGGCPNEAVREEQVSEALPHGSKYLPDCMGIEMVSPPKKYQGSTVSANTSRAPGISANDDRVLFYAQAGLAGTSGFLELAGDPYIATREASGWKTAPTAPPAGYIAGPGEKALAYGFSPDYSSWFQITGTNSETELGIDRVFRNGLGKSLTPLSPLLVPNGSSSEVVRFSKYQGVSADQSHVYFQPGRLASNNIGVAYLPGDPEPTPTTVASRSNTYVAHLNSDGEVAIELLARDRQGHVWGGNCGTRLGGDGNPTLTGAQGGVGWVRNQGAVSPNGSRVYFSARPTQPPTGACNPTANKLRIIKREETSSGPEITELSSSQCTRVAPPCDTSEGDDIYQGASVDGTKVYFTTNRQLANSDLDSGSESCSIVEGKQGCDLYLYDSTLPAGHHLIDVSAGDVTDPSPGSGAKVISGTVAISTDGSHVYFVAQGVLTLHPNPEGQTATAGAFNLYSYERDEGYPSGHLAFVGAVSSGDKESLWGGPTTFKNGAYPVPATGRNATGEEVGGDGHVLVFETKASLTANDTDGGKLDVYRYNAAGSMPTLECISCRPGGQDGESFEVAKRAEGVSASGGSGSDLLQTDRRVSEDGASVVFKTAEGLLPGEASGVEQDYLWRNGQLYPLPGSRASGLGDRPVVSADGSEVMFRAFSQLVPQDTDSAPDVYVARADGGYPLPVPPTPCEGEACQEPFSAQPAGVSAASESFAGPGNIALVQSLTVKPVVKPKTVSAEQKLARALKLCRKKARRHRLACEAQARRRYSRVVRNKNGTTKFNARKSSGKGGK